MDFSKKRNQDRPSVWKLLWDGWLKWYVFGLFFLKYGLRSLRRLKKYCLTFNWSMYFIYADHIGSIHQLIRLEFNESEDKCSLIPPKKTNINRIAWFHNFFFIEHQFSWKSMLRGSTKLNVYFKEGHLWMKQNAWWH